MERDRPIPIDEFDMDAIRREAFDFAGIGLYRYKLDGTIVFADSGVLKILDIEDKYPAPAALSGTNVADHIEYVGPRGLMRDELRKHGHVHDFEYPFKTLSGRPKWVLHDSYLVIDPETGEEQVQVIMRDITERKLADQALQLDESRFEALVKLTQMTRSSLHDITNFALEEGVSLTRSKVGYVAFLNDDESVLTMHSWSGGAMAQCRMQEKPMVYPVAETGLWGESVRQRKTVVTNDYDAPSSMKHGVPDGHVKINRHMNVPIFDDGHIVMLVGVGNKDDDYDGSDIRQLTLLMSGVWRIIKQNRAEDALKRANRTLKVLSAVNQILVRTDDEMSLLQDACNIIVEVGGFRMAWVGFARDDEGKTVAPVCYGGHNEGYLEGLKISWNDDSTGPTATAIRTASVQAVSDISDDPRCGAWCEMALARGYASFIALPLVSGASVLGTLNIYASQTHAFNESEVDMLRELADDIAFGISSIRVRELREHAEAELASQREDYLTIYNTVPAMIIYIDQDHRVVRANHATSRYFDIPMDRIIGRTLRALVPGQMDKLIADNIEVLSTGKPKLAVIERITFPNGDTRWFRTDKLPYKDRGGEVTGVIVFAMDITERISAEQKRLEMEAHQREFYKRTILAATQGKLLISESEEIQLLAGRALRRWEIAEGRQLHDLRSDVRQWCLSEGMDENRVYDMLLCLGEAATNAIKHGQGGEVSIHRVSDGVMLKITDDGPGIENLVLPDATLRLGYSTANSMGMGYKAIISISDKVYLATGPGGTTVAFEMRFQPEAMPMDIASLPDTW